MSTESKVLHPEFYTTFNQPVIDLLIEAIDGAAETACEVHQLTKEKGANNKIFGYGFYEYIKFQFEELANNHPGIFSIVRRGNWVGLKIGRFELGFYRIGRSENDDINKSFPANTCGAPRVVQLSLFDESVDEPDLTRADKFILGYMVNPDDGLCAVHVGVPKREAESNVIEDWAHHELLWKINRDEIFTPVDVTEDGSRPEPEVVGEIQLRKKKKTGDNEIDAIS